MDWPKTAKGTLVVVALGLFLVLAIFASSWGGIALIGAAIAIVTYLLYAGGVRFHRWVLGG